MTNNEKAKAYEMALEAARKELGCDRKEYKVVEHVLKSIFPELREREDEGIRKILIKAVNIAASADGGLLHSEASECLAWLEEQKDKNCLACDQHLKGYIAGRKASEEEKQKEQKPIMGNGISEQTKMNETVYKFTPEEWKKALDEQLPKEQKPVEWNDEYREEDLQTRFAFYTYKDDPSVLYLSNVFVEESSRNHGFGTRILKAAEKVAEAVGATTISLKVKQDSPANAWYRKRGYGYVAFEDGYDWLEKNLEYMKPNNPVEWSEEDETHLGWIIDCLEYWKNRVPDFADQYQSAIDWLKSLRPQPHWKPSEEHLSALLAIFNDPNNIGSQTCQLALTDLYEHLKKL